MALRLFMALLSKASENGEALADAGCSRQSSESKRRHSSLRTVQQGHLAMVQLLLGQGAAVNQATYNGFTPLAIAALGAVLK